MLHTTSDGMIYDEGIDPLLMIRTRSETDAIGTASRIGNHVPA